MEDQLRRFNNEKAHKISLLQSSLKKYTDLLTTVGDNVQKREVLQKNIDKLESEIKDVENKECVFKKNTKEKVVLKKKTPKNIVYKKEKQITDENRQRDRDARYFEKTFYKIVDSVPDYILRNLEEMPANKGYIWRGCWLFGKLRPENNYKTTVLFEKKGPVTKIFEFDDKVFTLSEKQGKERKQLIYTQQRIKKKSFVR